MSNFTSTNHQTRIINIFLAFESTRIDTSDLMSRHIPSPLHAYVTSLLFGALICYFCLGYPPLVLNSQGMPEVPKLITV